MEVREAAAASSGMHVIDVREYYEWAAGHVPGAIYLPLRHIPSRWTALPRDRPVLVTCQIGQRSALATSFLREKGIDAHNLEGGIEAWRALGHTLLDDSEASGRVVEGWAQTLTSPEGSSASARAEPV